MYQLHLGDCLEVMKKLPDQSIDLVVCDLPYGSLACKWDKRIPFVPLWKEYHRLCKENSAVVLFSSQPFTNLLINSNAKEFRYELIWIKNRKSGFMNAKKRPIKSHENILVFYKKQPVYNPQKTKAIKTYKNGGTNKGKTKFINIRGEKSNSYSWVDDGTRYPTTVLDFKCEPIHKGMHPTQKPVDLCEWLIMTYSNPGDTVLDNCMGLGTTGVAAHKVGRFFIGVELDPNYFEAAKQRIEETEKTLTV